MPKDIKYWIASYSIHAQILDNILSESNGEVHQLWVNAGGLRAPRMKYKNLGMLKNTHFSEKTLHAKVVLREFEKKSPEIWLWTGNFRKATFESQNILLSFPINNDLGKLKRWYSNPSNSILFYSNGKTISKIDFVKEEKCLWDYFVACMKRCVEKNAEYKLYAIAPWGSTRFVKDISELDFLTDAYFYTRGEEPLVDLWVEAAGYGHAFVPRKKWFPHLKCMFLTMNGKLVWSYIGSANFTCAAMFNKGKSANVEHALFFEGESANEQNKGLLDYLTDARTEKKDCLWMRRQIKRNAVNPTYAQIDESDQEKEEENDWQEALADFGNFNNIVFWQKYINLLMDKDIQKELDDAYRNGQEWHGRIKGKHSTVVVKILFVDAVCFHVVAYESSKKSELYERDIPRLIGDELPVSSTDACFEIDNLFSEKGHTLTKPAEDEPPQPPHEEKKFMGKDINVRFQIKNFYKKEKGKMILDVDLLNSVYEKLDKICKLRDSGKLILNEPYNKFLSIWLPIVRKMKANV